MGLTGDPVRQLAHLEDHLPVIAPRTDGAAIDNSDVVVSLRMRVHGKLVAKDLKVVDRGVQVAKLGAL